MIDVEDFCKQYDRTPAVSGLSFRVAAGRVLGMVGPNGAGKTTTLRAITGVIRPTTGRILVDGVDVVREPIRARQRLAYVPDDPPLFSDLTVDQHLSFTAAAFDVEEAATKADRLLDEFQLTAKRGERARNLSRGMRQKLAVCCAYLHDPTVILFDEPLTGLDPAGIRSLTASMRQRAAEGATVVVSSHLLSMVEDVCTDVLILDRGRRRFCGSLEELRGTYMHESEAVTLERVFFETTAERELGATTAPLSAHGGGER